MKEGGVDSDRRIDQAALEFSDGGENVACAFEAGASLLLILGEGRDQNNGGFRRAEDAEGAGRFVVAPQIGRRRIGYGRLRLGIG